MYWIQQSSSAALRMESCDAFQTWGLYRVICGFSHSFTPELASTFHDTFSSLNSLLAARCWRDASVSRKDSWKRQVLPVVPPPSRPVSRGQSCCRRRRCCSHCRHSHLLEQSSAVPLAVRGIGFIQGNLGGRKPCTQERPVWRRAGNLNALCIHAQDVSASVWL